ncbi:branched-chain amino acid ABC transporter permease [Myxococcus sp. MISCRS1]|uniref:branched-chain amino acid ABC transporter permease n=1 Tax=Myxococcus sp. MISCRS1 TaxID=2996786 RepID=UPI00226F1FBD|nr:branched-chain amino acid ABC transporter permease [Myxococcus sp. MISCRS1]MCY0999206.1 branched-chain amino acid ABC transporter permease [Myxococcus sp. MISCRS1]
MPTRPLVIRYEDDLKLFPGLWQRVGLLLTLAVGLSYPWLVSTRWLTVGNLGLVAIVGAASLMVLTGFAGQVSLGHAAFLALGAYTAAVLGTKLGWPFWLALPLAGGVSALVGVVIGAFALRLKGLYLAIVTLGLVFLTQHVLLAYPEVTSGLSGTAVPMYWWFRDETGAAASMSTAWSVGGVRFGFERKLYFLFAGLAAFTVWLTKNLQRSDSGRAMMAVRDQDLAAEVLGVGTTQAKLQAFGVSSFLAGIAGAMFAFQQQYITVEPPFDLNLSIQYIAMIVLGGVGTVFGAVSGALAFTFLSPLAETVGGAIPFVNQLTSAQQSTVLLSLVVVLVLVLEPLGLFGVWLRVRRYFQAWPFRY